MRSLALAILLIGSVFMPAHAQTYDPHFPVCLQSYSLGGGLAAEATTRRV